MKKLSFLLPILMVLFSCNLFIGDEIGRLQFNCNNKSGEEMLEFKSDLQKGEKIAFWTEAEMEYGSDPIIYFDVEIAWDEENLEEFELDIFDVNPTVKELKTSNGNKTKHRYNGKMMSFEVPENAEYTFFVTLHYPTNNNVKLKKVDFVFRK